MKHTEYYIFHLVVLILYDWNIFSWRNATLWQRMALKEDSDGSPTDSSSLNKVFVLCYLCRSRLTSKKKG